MPIQVIDINMDIALRLADEGVPLRAIARATQIPIDDLILRLREAKDDGRILELPRDDWPPGFPRDQRALELSRLVSLSPKATELMLRRTFGLAPMEVHLLLGLVQNLFVPKVRTGMTPRTMDVHMSNIRRKLRPYKIDIMTLWGYGYQLSVEARRKVLDQIFSKRSDSNTVVPAVKSTPQRRPPSREHVCA